MIKIMENGEKMRRLRIQIIKRKKKNSSSSREEKMSWRMSIAIARVPNNSQIHDYLIHTIISAEVKNPVTPELARTIWGTHNLFGAMVLAVIPPGNLPRCRTYFDMT